jgi:hypothetical protein
LSRIGCDRDCLVQPAVGGLWRCGGDKGSQAGLDAVAGAVQVQPDLAQHYAEVERRIGHRFGLDLSTAEIIAHATRKSALSITAWVA